MEQFAMPECKIQTLEQLLTTRQMKLISARMQGLL